MQSIQGLHCAPCEWLGPRGFFVRPARSLIGLWKCAGQGLRGAHMRIAGIAVPRPIYHFLDPTCTGLVTAVPVLYLLETCYHGCLSILCLDPIVLGPSTSEVKMLILQPRLQICVIFKKKKTKKKKKKKKNQKKKKKKKT